MTHQKFETQFVRRGDSAKLSDVCLDGLTFLEMHIMGVKNAAYLLENVIVNKCNVVNNFCGISRGVVLKNVRFQDLKAKRMEVSSSVPLQDVTVEGRWPKALSVKRLYLDRVEDEAKAFVESTLLNLERFSGQLDLWDFPLDKVLINPEYHCIVYSDMLDTVGAKDLDIGSDTNFLIDSIKTLKQRDQKHVIFDIPKSGKARREYDILKEAGLIR